jgi:hypothetical protein
MQRFDVSQDGAISCLLPGERSGSAIWRAGGWSWAVTARDDGKVEAMGTSRNLVGCIDSIMMSADLDQGSPWALKMPCGAMIPRLDRTRLDAAFESMGYVLSIGVVAYLHMRSHIGAKADDIESLLRGMMPQDLGGRLGSASRDTDPAFPYWCTDIVLPAQGYISIDGALAIARTMLPPGILHLLGSVEPLEGPPPERGALLFCPAATRFARMRAAIEIPPLIEADFEPVRITP